MSGWNLAWLLFILLVFLAGIAGSQSATLHPAAAMKGLPCGRIGGVAIGRGKPTTPTGACGGVCALNRCWSTDISGKALPEISGPCTGYAKDRELMHVPISPVWHGGLAFRNRTHFCRGNFGTRSGIPGS